MLRIDRGPGTLTLVSRFARPRALALLAGGLGAAAALSRAATPRVAVALAVLAALVLVAGGRRVRSSFAGGRVRVSPPVPFGRGAERSLGEFTAVGIETLGQARRRRAERRAHHLRARGGGELPSWLQPADVPGANDHLRRLVLEGTSAEPLAVTAWLAEDDLEAARAAVEALLPR